MIYVLQHTFLKQDVYTVGIHLHYDNYDKQDDHKHVFDYIDDCILEVLYHIQLVIEELFDHNDMLIDHNYLFDIDEKDNYDVILHIYYNKGMY